MLVAEHKLNELADFLQIAGCEVNRDKKDYRVMMFRSPTMSRHTQGHCNDRNIYVKFTGPETDLIQRFIDGEK